MQISLNDWIKYKNKLASISEKAADEMVQWLQTKGGYQNVSRTELIDYAYALSTKYGEASASLSALMYDETAEKSGVTVPSAEVADTATYGEVAKAVNGVTKKLTTDNQVGSVVNRMVKQAGADTTLKNAKRDGAQFAWVPAGDTCAFCLALAANGWQYASKEGSHADHIHPHCDCTYAVRFDDKSTVKGYDPEKYKKIFENAEGDTWEEKINSVRRMQYHNPEIHEKIRKQQNDSYAIRNGLASKDNNGTIIQIGNAVSKRKEEYSSNIIFAKTSNEITELLDRNNVKYEECKYLKNSLNSEEIIKKVGGLDPSEKGACSSQAFAYIGNKNGLDINDYRGGASLDFFYERENVKKIMELPSVKGKIIEGHNDYDLAHSMMKEIVNGKEYFFGVGGHASIVRKNENGIIEYLELQKISKLNGWKQLNDEVLNERFFCEKYVIDSNNNLVTRYGFLSDIKKMNNDDFNSILGYINNPKAINGD